MSSLDRIGLRIFAAVAGTCLLIALGNATTDSVISGIEQRKMWKQHSESMTRYAQLRDKLTCDIIYDREQIKELKKKL